MASINNDTSQTHGRFLDGAEEPRKMLQPIEGYQDLPLVSLEDSVESIISLCSDIHRRVYIAKENCKNLPPNHLTVDEVAAIQLYTMEWKPRVGCLYMALNTALRTENRDEITPWYLYLKLILSALTRIPSKQTIIWRGVKGNLSQKYNIGSTYIWWAFSSCTESLDVLESNVFLGKSGERTIFNIQCENGKDISPYSYIPVEKEILLLPAMQFVVKGKLNPSPGLHIIQLQETKPKFPMIELPVVSSKSSQSGSTNTAMNCNVKVQQRIYHCMKDCMYFGEFNLIDRDIPLIVEQAIKIRKCTFLDLNYNNITANGAEIVANALKTNTSLKILRFWHNHLRDAGASSISQALCSNRTLTTLCLANNGLTDKCIPDMVYMLKTNQSLTVLYLDRNKIGDEGMVSLMDSLHYNETLQNIYLHENAITDHSIDSTKKMFRKNYTLNLLSLGNNQFSDQGRDILKNFANSNDHIRLFV